MLFIVPTLGFCADILHYFSCISWILINVMLYAIWYHLYNYKNVKNTHGGVLLLVKLQASVSSFTKSNTPPRVFSRFLNCTNGTKSRKVSQIFYGYLHVTKTYLFCRFGGSIVFRKYQYLHEFLEGILKKDFIEKFDLKFRSLRRFIFHLQLVFRVCFHLITSLIFLVEIHSDFPGYSCLI